MSIGKMKDRVTAKLEKRIDNGRGGWIIEEVEQGTYWAEIIPLKARNIVQYRQADKNTNTLIKMRANDVITIDSVLYGRGHLYRIEEILEEDDFLTIMTVGEKIGQPS